MLISASGALLLRLARGVWRDAQHKYGDSKVLLPCRFARRDIPLALAVAVIRLSDGVSWYSVGCSRPGPSQHPLSGRNLLKASGAKAWTSFPNMSLLPSP